MDFHQLGWTPHFQQAYERLADATLVPARVTRIDRTLVHALARDGAVLARPPRGAPLAVGDWVAIAPADAVGERRVATLLPRRTTLARGAAGTDREAQLLAANVDVALLVMGLDEDFNPRRIERYLVAVAAGGVRPLVVLNKADACVDVAERLSTVRGIAPEVDVLVTSATEGNGIEALRRSIPPAKTAVFLGSSGVGKSSLVNALLGEIAMPTAPTRAQDGRGRHTTTHREMLAVPGGGIILDTPGMRELRLWADAEAVDATFSDVADLAASCRFRDCRHDREPGCAVRAALPADRLESYHKLKREAERSERTRAEAHRESRRFGRMARNVQEGKRRAREW